MSNSPFGQRYASDDNESSLAYFLKMGLGGAFGLVIAYIVQEIAPAFYNGNEIFLQVLENAVLVWGVVWIVLVFLVWMD